MDIYRNMKTFGITLITAAMLMWGCESSLDSGGSAETGNMQVKLHDSPADFEAVNISVARVEVNNTANEEEGWTVISEPNETYNILELVNGNFEVLADAELEAGTYEQIRIILNDENSVVIAGETFAMQVPSGEQTGLKLNINAEIQAGITYTLLLDFDANRSVVQKGVMNQFLLKPVIRATNEAITGNISGTILQAEARAAVYAIQESDTLSTTFADTTSGEFMLVGLESGSYTVSVEPREDGFEATSITDVSVNVGESSSEGEIELSVSGDGS